MLNKENLIFDTAYEFYNETTEQWEVGTLYEIDIDCYNKTFYGYHVLSPQYTKKIRELKETKNEHPIHTNKRP